MQEKNGDIMPSADSGFSVSEGFLERIQELALNFGSQRKLSILSGVNQKTFSRWKKRLNVTYETVSKISKGTGCSFLWLAYGQGDMFDDPHHFEDMRPTHKQENGYGQQKIKATIEPGPGRKKRLKQQQSENGYGDQSSWTMDDMLQMTKEVLESETIFKPALAANVRAFHQAILNEEEMQRTTKEIKALRMENKAIEDKLERLEEMLISLGASTQKKRDQA